MAKLWIVKQKSWWKYFSLNCAVEESSIGSRACCRLLEQDNIIRDNIHENDILVVSIGGNDIALRPSICTVISMLSLICCTTNSCLDSCANGCALPIDDCCCGFGTGSSIIILKIKCKKFFYLIDPNFNVVKNLNYLKFNFKFFNLAIDNNNKKKIFLLK